MPRRTRRWRRSWTGWRRWRPGWPSSRSGSIPRPGPGLARLESRLEDRVAALKAAHAAAEAALAARIATLEAPEANPFAEISEQLTRLYAQKDAAVETVFARLAPLEAKLAEVDRRLAGQDPAGALDRFAERLEAVQRARGPHRRSRRRRRTLSPRSPSS